MARRTWASGRPRFAPSPTKALTDGISGRRGVGRRRGAPPAPASAAAPLVARLRREQHGVALGFPRVLEFLPPLRELRRHFAACGPQDEEIVSGAESFVHQEREGAAAAPLLEARLRRPDLLHDRGEAARDGELVGLDVEHRVHRLEQRGYRLEPPRARFFPRREHLVPQERREQERRRHGLPRAHPAVGLLERESDEALPHRLLEHDVEQRQEASVQAFAAQLAQARRRVAREQQLLHFLVHPRRRHVLQEMRHLADGFSRALVDGEAELRREARGAQHPHRVLAVARPRVADDAHGLAPQVSQAVVVVEDGLAGRVVVQGVDREVAPDGVVLARAVDVVPKHPPVLVGFRRGARAKGRDLHRLLAEHDVHQLEAPADQARAPEELVHFLRGCVGGGVEVLRFQAEQKVAHRAADHVGLVAVALQHLAHLARPVRDRLAADAVLLLRGEPRLGAEPENAPDEFLDQEGRKLLAPASSRRHWYSASRLAWVSISLERPRLARPASYSKTEKLQRREHGLSVRGARGKQAHHLRLVAQVEMLQRLVEEQDLRVLYEDLSDARALALSARERAIGLGRMIGEIELGERRLGERGAFRVAAPGALRVRIAAEHDVIEHAAPETGVLVLGQHGDAPGEIAAPVRAEWNSVERDRARLRGAQAGEGENKARLACAVATEQRPALPRRERKLECTDELAAADTQLESFGPEHQRDLARRRSSTGTPISAVTTPTGSSVGAASERASVSASASRLPPRQAASGKRALWRWMPQSRSRCGTTSPTKPIEPPSRTAATVAIVAQPKAID